MTDRLVAENPDYTRHSKQTNIHASGGIRTRNLKKRMAEDHASTSFLLPRDLITAFNILLYLHVEIKC
jgi:hypothetical protein